MDITLDELIDYCSKKSGNWRPAEPIYLSLEPEFSILPKRSSIKSTQLCQAIEGLAVVIDLDARMRVVGIELLPDPLWQKPKQLT